MAALEAMNQTLGVELPPARADGVIVIKIPALQRQDHVSGSLRCSPTGITQEEAETLVEATLELNAVRQSGGKSGPVVYTPTEDYSPFFYYFVVYDSVPARRTSAAVRPVGYFAVQHSTGKVFDLKPSPKDLDDEPGLKLLQQKLRRQHCVTDEVLEKWHDSEP